MNWLGWWMPLEPDYLDTIVTALPTDAGITSSLG